MSFDGRTVLITGASLGVGRATARAFHRAGANVALVARRREPLEAVSRELARSLVLPGDAGDSEVMAKAIEATVAQFGGLHGLVNNAAVQHWGPVASRSVEELGAVVDVNLRAPILLTRMALPHLRRQGGFVVNVSSLAGRVPIDGEATYCATKAGLRAFTYALAEELRPTGVTASVVSPGPVETGFILDDIDAVDDLVFSQTMCTAEDVAEMILACARDGRLERAFPAAGARLADLLYLLPGLRRPLRPVFEARGRRVKGRMRRRGGRGGSR